MSDLETLAPLTGMPDSGMNANGEEMNKPSLVDQAKQQAHRVVEQTQQKAGEAVDLARDRTKSWAEQQMVSAADTIDGVVLAARQTGQHLRENNQEHLRYAEFTEGAAEAVERVSTYLRDARVDEVVDEVERFAKRQPALFLSIAAALGFCAARFLRSSRQSGSSETPGWNPDRQLPMVLNDQTTGMRRDNGTDSAS
jgi:hypothetical protein